MIRCKLFGHDWVALDEFEDDPIAGKFVAECSRCHAKLSHRQLTDMCHDKGKHPEEIVRAYGGQA